MSKILKTLVGGALVASSLCADIARVEMGAGIWQQTPKGSLTTKDTTGALSLDGTYTTDKKDSSETYFWILVKHPLPIVPNLRAEYVSVSDTGITKGKVNGIDVTSGKTTIDMKQFDIIPYYNLVDNTAWITLDLGVDIKVIQTDAVVKTIPEYSGSETVALPLLYVRGRVEIPATDIGVESDVKYITNGDSTVYDVRAKVDYTFDVSPVIQPAIEVGYRVMKFDINEPDTSTKGMLEYSGVYAGMMLRF